MTVAPRFTDTTSQSLDVVVPLPYPRHRDYRELIPPRQLVLATLGLPT